VAAVRLGGKQRAPLQVHHRFRRPRGPARVLPEAHVVAARCRGLDRTGSLREKVDVRVGDGDRRTRVALHERKLFRSRERRKRHRDRADLHGAEERGDEFRRIAED
jgi:hypothetical protein